MKVSVIIPTFNSCDTLERCIKSIDGQNVHGLEMVIVDDGSTDETSALLESITTASDLIYIEQGKLGVAHARNRGFAEATGDWVMFVDSDDWLPEASLAAFLELAESTQPDICIGDFYLNAGSSEKRVSNLNTEQRQFNEDAVRTFQWLCIARVGFNRQKNVGLLGAPWAKLYRRTHLARVFPDGEVNMPGLARAQDVVFNVRAFNAVTSVAYLPEPVYVYSAHATSSTHRHHDQYVANLEAFLAALSDEVEQLGAGDLAPAVAKIAVVLLEEAFGRGGGDWRLLRKLASLPTFGQGLAQSRFRDYSVPGRLKLALLKLHAWVPYSVLWHVRSLGRGPLG